MVIDASALIALLLDEPEAAAMAAAIAADPKRLLSAVSALEASIVIEARKGASGGRELDLLLKGIGAQVVSLDARQAELARDAWRRFGKGRHAAGLNIGDCCAYALASAAGEPLLYKGRDFGETDLPAVKYPGRAP